MPIIEISSLSHPGIEVFSTLTEAQLRNRIEPDKGLFIAESPKVIRVALDAGYEPLALLCEQKHITGDAADIISRCGDVPVYTGGRELLATLTGYVLTRGVLCAMRRPAPRTVEDTCRDARRIVVIDGVVDTTNIGAIFRSAAALGMDAVLLTRNSCDPLNRRAVRVSMGSVFLVPWTWLDGTLSDLARLPHRRHGTYGQFYLHCRSCLDVRTPASHCDGNGGRGASTRYDCRGGLCSPYPDGAWGRFAQCGGGGGRGVLAT